MHIIQLFFHIKNTNKRRGKQMGNVQIQSRRSARRKIFQQRRAVSPNEVYLHRSLILDKNAMKRNQKSCDCKRKNYSRGFQHKKLQNRIDQYKVTLPSQRYKIGEQVAQRNSRPLTRGLSPIKRNQPLTQRNNNSNRQCYHINIQQVRSSLQKKDACKYHEKQFKKIMSQRRNKQEHPVNVKRSDQIQSSNYNFNLTQKKYNCWQNETKMLNYPKNLNAQSSIDCKCNQKLQKLTKIRNQIENYNQNPFNISIFQNSRIEQKKAQRKQDSIFNYPLTERIRNEQTPYTEIFEAFETERKHKKTNNRDFRDEYTPTRVFENIDQNKNDQFQAQKSSCPLSGSGLQQNYERCNILVNKVKDFNVFLNQVKSKIEGVARSSKKDKTKNIKDYQENAEQFRLNSRGSNYSEKDQSIVQIEKRSKIPIQDAKIQNIKSLNLNLQLQNEKIQLEKYKRLFDKQLSKQHSIQRVTIQDKINSKGEANRKQKILTIEYYEPQQNLSSQENAKIQGKTDKRIDYDDMKCSNINQNEQIGQKYRQMTENVKQLGILLGINGLQKQSQRRKELHYDSNYIPQSRQKKQDKMDYKNLADIIKRQELTPNALFSIKKKKTQPANKNTKILTNNDTNQQYYAGQVKSNNFDYAIQSYPRSNFDKNQRRTNSNQYVQQQQQQRLGTKDVVQKVNKRKKRIQDLLQHVQHVNTKQQKIESTLYEWLQRTYPSCELQSSLDSQY